MKRSKLFTTLLITLVMMAMSPQKVWATNGTLSTTTIDGDTYYQIADSKDLAAFSNLVSARTSDNAWHMGYNAILTADITWDSSVTFNTIGVNESQSSTYEYTGTFDGNGHTIRSLRVTTSRIYGTAYDGIFTSLSGATVKNLNLTDIDAKMQSMSGGFLMNSMSGATLSNIYIEGKMSIYNWMSSNGVISSSCNACTLTNVGVNVDLAFDAGNESYSTGCGFFCSNSNKTTLTNCWFSGKFTGINASNAAVSNYKYRRPAAFYYSAGTSSTSSVTATNCYAVTYQGDYLSDYYVKNTGVSYKEPSAFASGEIAYLLNGSTNGVDTWRQTLGTDNCPTLVSSHALVYRKCYEATYINSEAALHKTFTNGICTSCSYNQPCSGAGTEASPYLITNAGNLLWFRDQTNSGTGECWGKLTADVDMNGVNWNNSIGENSNRKVYFNGNSLSIKNLNTCTGGSSGKARALFCHNYGRITGLTLENPDVYHNDAYQGCLIRRNWATIDNCLVLNGRVQADAVNYLAGFCGVNEANATISNCGIVGTTVQRNGDRYATAFVDVNCAGGKIENCFAKDCNFTNKVNNAWFVAYNRAGATLSNCYFSWGTSVVGTRHTGCIPGSGNEIQYDGLKLVEDLNFTSGEVCYLLNGSTNGGTTWYQNLASGGDAYPVLKANDNYKVYRYTHTYCSGTQEARYTNSSTQQNTSGTHSFTSYTYNNDATCAKAGTMTATCDNGCGTTNTKDDPEHPATGKHEFTEDSNGFCTVCSGYQPATLVNSVYEIVNAGQLYWFATIANQYPNINGKLISDITINDGTFATDGTFTATGATTTSTPRSWNVINTFRGTFDGDGHSIKGLYSYKYSNNATYPETYPGFISQNYGTIQNLGIKTAFYEGASTHKFIGGFCSYNYGKISNCHIDGAILTTRFAKGKWFFSGGITSYNKNGIITQCSASNVNITAKNSGDFNVAAAGICAISEGGNIETCHVLNINININDPYNDATYRAGGICGDSQMSNISNCYSKGVNTDITLEDNASVSIGGIAGVVVGGLSTQSSITNVYTNDVNLKTNITGSLALIGGIAGHISYVSITNCYTTHATPVNHAGVNSTVTKVEGSVTPQRFQSGEIAWLLNGSVDESGTWTAGPTNGTQTWYQTLTGENADAYPVLTQKTGNTVYCGYTNCAAYQKTYANTALSQTRIEHQFAEGDLTRSVCAACNHGFFRYSSTDNNPVTPKYASQLLGADGRALSFTNKYIESEGKCVMEFNEPLVTIGEQAFRQCTGFTGDLIIPNSVKNIGFEAFKYCGFTGTLTIGSSVESIGSQAFWNCSNFTCVEMKSVPSVGSSAFEDNVNKTLVLSDDSYVYTGLNPIFPTINSFSYPRTVTGGNIVTFVLPVSVPVSSINGKVWKFSTYEDDKFKFTAVTDDNTETNVPYLVQLDESATELLDGNITGDLTINAPGTPKVTSADGHVMHIGSYTKQSVASDEYSAYYGFSQASHQFVKAKSGTLNPFRTMFEIDNFRRFDDWTSLNPCSFGAIDTSLDGDDYPDNTRDYTFTAKTGDVLSFNYTVLTEMGVFNVYLCNGTATIGNYQSGENILNVDGQNAAGEYKKVFDTAGTYTLVFEYEGKMGDVDNAYITNICLKSPLSASSSASSQVRTFIDLQLGMDEDEETQIIRVDADAITGTGSPMYNLSGQRITNPVKGQIYIQNGKKIMK